MYEYMFYPDLENVSAFLLTFRQTRQQFIKEHHGLQNTWMVHTKLGYFVYMSFSPVILYTLPERVTSIFSISTGFKIEVTTLVGKLYSHNA